MCYVMLVIAVNVYVCISITRDPFVSNTDLPIDSLNYFSLPMPFIWKS